MEGPIEERSERVKKRNREEDPKTIQELREKEKIEESPIKTELRLHKVRELANIIINNDGTKEELYIKLDKFLQDFSEKKREKHISWDDYFVGIALLSAKRSKDPSTQTGACIVDSKNRVVGIGYNGFPRGCSDDKLPWGKTSKNLLERKYTYVVHAEANAILNSTKNLENCRIYVDLFPCHECTKLIIQSGIKEIIYRYDTDKTYIDSFKASKRMLEMAKVKTRKYNH